MLKQVDSDRVAQGDVEDRFIERWSPRSFDPEFKVSDQDLESIFEAARWSPSSFNAQPWHFVIAKKGDEEFELFKSLLVDANQKWAKDSSVLSFIVARRHFDNGDKNPHHAFDCGSAWFAMTMQAQELGLHTHGMAGVHFDKVYPSLKIDKEKFRVVCAFALGKRAKPDKLPKDLEKAEKKNNRKKLTKVFSHARDNYFQN